MAPPARKVIITCAVTGSIHTPSMSPHLPVTPDEIAEAAIGAAEAGAAFTILSIGDGLVSQIPALIVSTGAALLTTRGGSGGGLGTSLGAQLLGNHSRLCRSSAARLMQSLTMAARLR